MLKKVELSIIVPVYNVEKYVERCLKSLCGLTIENEIIVVNDGSTDNSLEVVKKFKENHIEENIKIITQENRGQSVARNIGIMEAKGEYIHFIDSDDFIDREKYEDIIRKTIENDLDFGIGNYVDYYDNTIKNSWIMISELRLSNNIKTGKELFSLLMDKKYYRNGVVIRIIKRKFIEKYKIFFKEGNLCEDILYSFYLHYYAEKTMLFDINFYNYYRENVTSITNTKNVKKSLDILDSVSDILNEIKKLERSEFTDSVIEFIYWSIIAVTKNVNIFELKKILKKMKKILKENKKILLNYDKKIYKKHLKKNIFNIVLKNFERKIRHKIKERKKERKIGILYICTGKYEIFFEKFYKSCEKYFFIKDNKTYFVFTDSEKLKEKYKNMTNIKFIYQKNLGWPHNTLMRYEMFEKQRELYNNLDYMYFFNANVIFKSKVDEEFIPNEDEKGIVAVEHPGFFGKSVQDLTYEENKKSLAYIPKNLKRSYKYFCGGINGGTKEEFLKLIIELNGRIKKDSENEIIALWHDESHFNKYIWELENNVKILSTKYAYPEGWRKDKYNHKIMLRDKNKLGGHDYLRN